MKVLFVLMPNGTKHRLFWKVFYDDHYGTIAIFIYDCVVESFITFTCLTNNFDSINFLKYVPLSIQDSNTEAKIIYMTVCYDELGTLTNIV